MARTTRKVPPGKWSKDFEDKLRRGHVSIDKKDAEGIDEIWGQGAKKHHKKLRSKANRRENKKTWDEQEDV